MATGIVHHDDQNLEKQIEKQIGCMTGFLHIFDRNQILAGKRLYTTKRLPPCPAVDSTSASVSKELKKVEQKQNTSDPDKQCRAPEAEHIRSDSAESPVRKHQHQHRLPLPIFDFKQGSKSSWKLRESPRLSLDSRATVDAKGTMYPVEIRTSTSALSIDDSEKQRRSTSVVAKLMGLEEVSHSSPENKSELRRSASESRVPRDLRFMDSNNNSLQKQNQFNAADSTSNVMRNNARIESNARQSVDPVNYIRRSVDQSTKVTQRGMNWKSPHQRKSYFDSADFFPEPKQSVSIYGEIEKRLRMRGIDEPSKDLETLKQILDALQLKGLLHSTKSLEQELSYQNFIYDRNFSHDESPIVLMNPRSQPGRHGGTVTVPRRNINTSGDGSPAGSPRRDRNSRNSPRGRNSNSPSRSESSVTSTNSVLRRKSLTVEDSRSGNDWVERRTVSSPVHSPKVTFRRASSSDHAQSPRSRKPTAVIRPKPTTDESSTISECRSHTDTERREGRSLLERCDKLLHSIAEMNTSELQPSPVSVLDSSFYKDDDDTASPSPFLKRSIDFKVDLEDELWCPAISPVQSKQGDDFDDCDFIYISDILRASNCHPDNSDIFSLLEHQQYLKGKDASRVCTLQRKLTFDTVTEILERNKRLPPWKTISQTLSLHQIWTEYQKIGERDESKDLFEVIVGVLRKDLAGDSINGWGECHVESSEAVLDIERMVFKDLIGETIRDLAALAGKNRVVMPRRKLLF